MVAMEPDELRAALAKIPLFSSLPPALLAEISGLTSAAAFDRGSVIFTEGDAAAFLPILLSGRVKLYRADADGREQLLHLVKAPASFAEAAVFGLGVFPVTAEAMEPVTIAKVSRPELLALLRRRPEVALALLASMSTWLRHLVDLIDDLALRSVEERVAAYMWSAFSRSGVEADAGVTLRLEDPKHVIAAICGTAPEVLSRTFRKLEQAGATRVDGPLVTLLDPARLAALARADELA
jgi:CRP/FNR family transcriptional regulator, dissimilatory nitrate respiration regulator